MSNTYDYETVVDAQDKLRELQIPSVLKIDWEEVQKIFDRGRTCVDWDDARKYEGIVGAHLVPPRFREERPNPNQQYIVKGITIWARKKSAIVCINLDTPGQNLDTPGQHVSSSWRIPTCFCFSLDLDNDRRQE